MSEASIGMGPAAGLPRNLGTMFFAALAFATMVPLAMLPLADVEGPAGVPSLLLGIWMVTGFGHVMSTVWFALDEDYRPVIDGNRWRMIGSLAALPIALVGLVLMAPGVANWVIAAYWVWQAHHYNRQNFGIMSLAAAHDGAGPLPKQVNWVLHLATGGGALILVTMPGIYSPGVTTPPLIAFIDVAIWHRIAAILLVAAAGTALYLAVTREALRRSPTVLLFLLLSVVFFLPGLASTSPITAFWPYAIAHGAQYLIIMGVTARQSRRRYTGLIILMLLAYALGIVAYALVGVSAQAFYIGIVMWHFLADARLWRLRDPQVRAIVRSRFNFVFRPAIA